MNNKANLDGKKSMAYGIRSVKEMKQKKKMPSSRQARKVIEAHDYFLKQVDPIIAKCITYLLCIQHDDVPVAMLEYLTKLKDGAELDPLPFINFTKPRREQKVFLATTVGPIINKLVNRVALARPENVLEYFCSELSNMISCEKSFLYDKKEEDLTNPIKRVQFVETPAKEIDVKNPKNDIKNTNQLSLTSSMSELAISNVISSAIKSVTEPKKIQILFIGVAGVGKTSIINCIQGKPEATVKPTLGFRPSTMALESGIKVALYDLGGGKKIRDIWNNYYHDVHGIIYVVDSSSSTAATGDLDEARENLNSVVLAAPLLRGKPMLILANKQDKDGALSADELRMRLNLQVMPSHLKITECSALPQEGSNPEESAVSDPRIEQGLEWLLKEVQLNYSTLNGRVVEDTKQTELLEAKKRFEREKKVLTNKIASAFAQEIDPSKMPDIGASNPDDIFTKAEGLTFLASEIGVELDLPGMEVASLVGYQRLALQMVGALKAPISKKKVPMSWGEIRVLIAEIRKELGLPS